MGQKMKKDISWIQLSDLHIFESTDWDLMREGYRKLSERIHPDFIVVTGDYRLIITVRQSRQSGVA